MSHEIHATSLHSYKRRLLRTSVDWFVSLVLDVSREAGNLRADLHRAVFLLGPGFGSVGGLTGTFACGSATLARIFPSVAGVTD